MHNNNTNRNAFRTTLKDIAIKTGYTVNTISRALKNKEDISLDTRKLIQETAKDMGYISNSIAGALRSGFTNTFAVILGDISNLYFSIIVKEIEKTARKSGYTTFIINTEENHKLEREAITSALQKKVDGIIICPTQRSRNNIELLKKSAVPFVLLGRYYSDIDTDYVISDDINGGYLATKHLIERGHRRILFINGPGYISSATERQIGYENALNEHCIPVCRELIREVQLTSGYSIKMIRKLVEEGIQFTAVFAFSDMLAWEAVWELQNMGYKVPQDIAVIGFDNIQSKMIFPFPLSTINSYKEKTAQRAVNILLKKIQNNSCNKYFNEIIETSLVIREST